KRDESESWNSSRFDFTERPGSLWRNLDLCCQWLTDIISTINSRSGNYGNTKGEGLSVFKLPDVGLCSSESRTIPMVPLLPIAIFSFLFSSDLRPLDRGHQ